MGRVRGKKTGAGGVAILMQARHKKWAKGNHRLGVALDFRPPPPWTEQLAKNQFQCDAKGSKHPSNVGHQMLDIGISQLAGRRSFTISDLANLDVHR